MPTTLTCSLTYFKKNGKYYSDGSFVVAETTQLYEIWELVRAMRKAGALPGLVEGAGPEYTVLVNVPGHRHEHPHLIV